MDLLAQVFNGLGIGSIYALVALGYSMVYGIVQLINFAHGDIIMVGAYVTYVGLVMAGMPLWAAVLVSILFCGVAGVLIEKLAYSRLLKKRRPQDFPIDHSDRCQHFPAEPFAAAVFVQREIHACYVPEWDAGAWGVADQFQHNSQHPHFSGHDDCLTTFGQQDQDWQGHARNQ